MEVGTKATHHGHPVVVERYDGGLYAWIAYDGTGKRRQVPIGTLVPIEASTPNDGQRKATVKPIRMADPRREFLKAYIRTITSPEDIVKSADKYGIDITVDRTKFGNAKMQLMNRLWAKIVSGQLDAGVLY